MTKFFLSIFKFLKNRKGLRISLILLLSAFILFFATKITLEEDISGFMPSDEQNERVNFVYKNIAIADKIIVRFSAADDKQNPDKNLLIDAAEQFATSLDSVAKSDETVREIFYKVDQQQIFEVTDFITANIPYYLTEADYKRIDSLLTPGNIRALLEKNKELLVSPTGMVLKQQIVNDPLHLSSGVLKRLNDFQVSDQYIIYDNYIFSKDGKNLLLFITAANPVSETAINQKMIVNIDDCIANLNAQMGKDVRVNYFGAAAVAVSNAKRIKADSYISIAIAVVLILTLLLWYFRSLRTIILIAVPVIFGALLALTALFFIKGTISAIAIGAGSVIFGIAINYSLHYLIHSKHENNQEKVLKEIASPMLVGSITTVGAFLSLLFISADSMRDFGLFAAFSLTGTLLFVLIFLPHFLKNKARKPKSDRAGIFDKISEYRIEKNRYVLWTVLLITPVLFYFSRKVSFETDMNKINYMTADQRQSFDELSNFTTLGKKSIYLVSDGNTLDAALRGYEKAMPMIDSLMKQGAITGVSGIGELLQSSEMQRIKIDRWNDFWKTRKETLKTLLVEEGKTVGFKVNSFNTFYEQLDRKFLVQPYSYFSPVSDNFIKDYLIVKSNRAMVVTMIYTAANQSDNVASKLSHGDTFVFDSGSMAKSLINLLSNDFNMVLYFCGFLVLLFLTISFGRLELSLIAFLPMLISWVWILGIMSIFEIHFNIVNIILATFIFGLGDDYTIFMMDGMMNEYSSKRKLLTSYKTAVALSAITMFIGIGTLIFAKHPAMKSLADVTIIGMISVVFISYIIPPLFFSALTTKNGKKRMVPVTFRNFFASFYSFVAFLMGSLYLTIRGYWLLSIQKPTDSNKLLYHRSLQKMAGFVMRQLPLVNFKVINHYNEDFEKPAVIICNHQSHIDLMYIMMLYPKTVILTNEWVWNSPFYGKLVKYADYYPVANGIENSTEQLKLMIDKGYSVVVFPEGTRSEDCSILRFHKGAFYLAEKLNLDIIPIVLHGIGHALPKTEMLLRKGNVAINILDRIKPADNTYGDDYTQRAKNIRKLFLKEYAILSEKFETPEYFKDHVIHNYIYKGASVEWHARKLLKNNNSFSELIQLLPNKGSVLVPNCGYGVFALLCSLVKKDLQITATDFDNDKIDLAENCVSKPKNLTFVKFENLKEMQLVFDILILINPDDDKMLSEFAELCSSKYIVTEKNSPVYNTAIADGGYAFVECESKRGILKKVPDGKI